MTYALTTVNPFYATRNQRVAPARQPAPDQPIYARLPRAPITGSPVQHLTSLSHFHRTGEYGPRKGPGIWGGMLIRDLLNYFKPKGLVCDPMAGSGTCRDVCEELGIPCFAWDIHQNFDACDPKEFPSAETFEFIWAHPPYWRQKLYANDLRDLSRSPSLDHFLTRYAQFIKNCKNALKPGGKLCILIGDYNDREAGFVPLTHHTKRLAFAAGLKQHCTDIIRFSHGASSGKKTYRSSFIPGLHDVCMVFERP